ncbi:prephenate/arogenate dehydrogenase family protein [Parvibaculum sp.]|uniref:prephenate/arogenate dehydrogenase family protein n=1 Tax=Parvibaculum sp. TaxID=2024848 RepID=UPI001B2F7300|nr:prephenate/arogenate dehydrogenase family protein [Parvibaculum sp.]MBO6633197.1 prephenate/arogenate dehydrogenase family protein [Parvibaculum sp.]MBO6677120.1 prephenate/arogenate dehydrogenase family protein [Parvibaculum sp.]MBO6683920.1 prephenate/arogenate dehydrogenase family protein [Parvibaculum sp.]MBO6904294.1 prephenate/arogenate dehydrogenase family protein [Parvibaculum sp.]
MSGEVHFERVALIGLGLIGGSLGHAMRRAGLARHVAGYARSEATRKRALEIGFVDSVHASAADAARDADLVVVCTPVGALGAVAAEIEPHLKKGAILTDVGSVKMAVIRDIGPHVPEGVHFIPGHPIAGTEESGPDAGFAELFDGRWCILTPVPGTDEKATEKLSVFWTACGSKVDVMEPKHHDMVLAIVSHLPHIIAYNIVGTASDLETVTQSEVIKYSASGFRDFTRLAASDPTMWRDVCLNNKEPILEMLARFSEDLTALQRAIRWGDGDVLFDLFTRTRAIRRSIVDAGQDTDAPNFGRNPTHPKPAGEGDQ